MKITLNDVLLMAYQLIGGAMFFFFAAVNSGFVPSGKVVDSLTNSTFIGVNYSILLLFGMFLVGMAILLIRRRIYLRNKI